MQKQVWIHIGPPKTGTSAIQKWLLAHSAWLAEQGIMYPAHTIGANGISSGHVHTLLSEVSGTFEVDTQKVGNLLAEFEQSECSMLLLSSEHFFYHAEALAEAFTKVRFIAYVRCPIETFESGYNQSVKRHGKTDTLTFGKNLHTTTLNRLSNLANELTTQKFYFRAYLQSNEHFNLVADFLSAFKLEYPVENDKTNPSYTFEALETKRWLNQFQLHDMEPEIDQAFQAMATGTSDYTLLPGEHKERHLKQCVQQLRLFHAAHHIKNARLLFNALGERSHLTTVSQDTLSQSVSFVSEQLHQSNPHLYQRICRALADHPIANNNQSIVAVFNRFHVKPSAMHRFKRLVKKYSALKR